MKQEKKLMAINEKCQVDKLSTNELTNTLLGSGSGSGSGSGVEPGKTSQTASSQATANLSFGSGFPQVTVNCSINVDVTCTTTTSGDTYFTVDKAVLVAGFPTRNDVVISENEQGEQVATKYTVVSGYASSVQETGLGSYIMGTANMPVTLITEIVDVDDYNDVKQIVSVENKNVLISYNCQVNNTVGSSTISNFTVSCNLSS